MTSPLHIDGTWHPDFAPLREVFIENFRSRGELGAAICVYRHGEKVVDLWGGVANRETGALWQEDTICCMMSVGKSMAAFCLLMLIDRGKVDLEAPVTRYWPEYGQAGKEKTSVRMILSALSGVLYADAAPDGAAYDWDLMCRALAAQKPEWEPGSQGAYHSMSAGFLLGELVRRVDGRPIDRFFTEEIARPMGVDYRYGVGDGDLHRVSDIMPNPASTTFTQTRDITTKLGRAWRVRPASPTPYNDPAFRGSVVPSVNGHGNARAIARVYAALANGGTLDGFRLLSPTLVEAMRTESWRGTCGMTDRPFRYGLGLFLNYPPMMVFGANPRAFGHPGAGGAVGIADPEVGLSFAYSPNLMCAGAGMGDRCQALVEAALGPQATIEI
ncbi:serine hydrolase domain-containing protein [Niveispirillum sp. KHB5.9]|uniref:serine hydrolase domain-containing protein n=1 Tax=Niveispirillum sp. KHB5.9 TaxID=3400269 RepID=UPI003A878763